MKKSVGIIILFLLLIFVFVGCENKESIDNISNLNSNEDQSSNGDYEKEDFNEIDNTTSKVNDNIVKNDSSIDDTLDSNTNEVTHKYDGNSVSKNENKTYSVTFLDYDGSVLKTEIVQEGESANPPEKPRRDGFNFVKWDTSFENVKVNITVTAIYEEITLPTLIVDEVKGEKNRTAIVKINVANNPGILAMLLNIKYDENAMKLKKVENGSLMRDYMFTPPKNMQSGCNAAWNINDIPEGEKDGELIVLYFEVSSKVKKGVYPISVSCFNNAIDNDYNIVHFEIINGAIVID